jgi:hypothetical protein
VCALVGLQRNRYHHHHHHLAVKDVGQCWPVLASETICQFLHRSAPISSSFSYKERSKEGTKKNKNRRKKERCKEKVKEISSQNIEINEERIKSHTLEKNEQTVSVKGNLGLTPGRQRV